jgi:hypothetical protein
MKHPLLQISQQNHDLVSTTPSIDPYTSEIQILSVTLCRNKTLQRSFLQMNG